MLVASHTAVNFFFEQKLIHYLIFVCAFSVALVWFIGKVNALCVLAIQATKLGLVQSFWFLKVDFGARLPIQTVAIFLTMMFVLALIVPGALSVSSCDRSPQCSNCTCFNRRPDPAEHVGGLDRHAHVLPRWRPRFHGSRAHRACCYCSSHLMLQSHRRVC